MRDIFKILAILLEFFGDSLGILWGFFGNSLGIFWEFFGNSLGILWESSGMSNASLSKTRAWLVQVFWPFCLSRATDRFIFGL